MCAFDKHEDDMRQFAFFLVFLIALLLCLSLGVTLGKHTSYKELGVQREEVVRLKAECGDNCIPSIIYLPVAEEK